MSHREFRRQTTCISALSTSARFFYHKKDCALSIYRNNATIHKAWRYQATTPQSNKHNHSHRHLTDNKKHLFPPITPYKTNFNSLTIQHEPALTKSNTPTPPLNGRSHYSDKVIRQEKKTLKSKYLLRKKDFHFTFTGCLVYGKSSSVMNKSELVEVIQKNLGADATKRAAEDALSAVLAGITEGVKKDGKVQLIGFGTFQVKERAARQGRNPKTGEAMQIKASKTVGFKCSSSLKGAL
jgi:DNA-binding protein HU-beta